MNDSLKTMLFVLAALLMLGVAIALYYQTQPVPLDDFQLVGQPFLLMKLLSPLWFLFKGGR